MVSVAAVEIGATYVNLLEATMTSTYLIDMGHTQLPNQIKVDNSMAVVFYNKSITQKLSKSIDTCFY